MPLEPRAAFKDHLHRPVCHRLCRCQLWLDWAPHDSVCRSVLLNRDVRRPQQLHEHRERALCEHAKYIAYSEGAKKSYYDKRPPVRFANGYRTQLGTFKAAASLSPSSTRIALVFKDATMATVAARRRALTTASCSMSA